MKLLIATPAYGGILTTAYFNSFLETMSAISDAGHEMAVITMDRDALISRARNACAMLALENNFDKILFIDADTVWKSEDVFMLLKSERKIVGGTYPYKKFPIKLVYNAMPNREASPSGEVEVSHLPTGFMLIDTVVFKDLEKTATKYLWFDEVSKTEREVYDFFPIRIVDGRYETEDWGFCSEARKVGFKIYLQTKCVVDHLGFHQFSAK